MFAVNDGSHTIPSDYFFDFSCAGFTHAANTTWFASTSKSALLIWAAICFFQRKSFLVDDEKPALYNNHRKKERTAIAGSPKSSTI